MIDGLKPYPTYKGSGVPWLGQVPEHWKMRRGKWLFRKMALPASDADDVVTCFRDGIVTLRKNRRTRGFTEAIKEIGYQGIRRGDLVIHAMDAFAGAIGVSDTNGKGTPMYSVCEPSEQANADYYAFVLREMARAKWILALATGIRERSTDFRYEAFAAQQLPLPQKTEQDAIVRFLKAIVGRLGHYIRLKKRLVELLKEQRQAITDRAVTRGLDPDVRLKPSGVASLGDVPEHWDVSRSRYLFREVDARSQHGLEAHLSMSQRLGLVPSNLVDNRTLVSESYVGGKLCEPNDLVLNRLKAHLGVFALAHDSGVISPDYTVLRPTNAVGVDYFEQVLKSPVYRSELRFRTKGIVEGFWRLYTEDFYTIRLPVPPPAERMAIIEHNRRETIDIDHATVTAEHEIALLEELRTRLVADVVTGKLDVREAALCFPDDAIDNKLPEIGDTSKEVDDDAGMEMTADDAEA